MFNAQLTTITGANKNVTDTGPLIDPTLAALGGVNDLFDAGVKIADGIDNKKKQKQAQTAKNHELARQARSDERAEITFANTQSDRAASDRSDNFNDSAATSMRAISKVQSAIKQGTIPSSSLRLETEKHVTSLLTEFPDHSAELNEQFKANGLSHLLLGDLQDQKSAHEAEREARESAETDAIKIAYSRNLADENTPKHEAVDIGQTVSATEATVQKLNEQKRLAQENRRLSQEDQKAAIASADRKLVKTGIESANKLSGMITGGFINKMRNVTTVEQFTNIQAEAPSILANLEEERFSLHESVGFNPDAIKHIDATLDRQKNFLNQMVTGDLSFAKRQATEMTNVKNNLKLDMWDTTPALAFIETLPRAISDPLYQTVGAKIAGNDELGEGLADLIVGINSQAAQMFTTVTDERGTTDPSLSPEEQKAKVQYKAMTLKGARAKLLEGTDVDVYAPEYVEAHNSLLAAYDRVMSNTKDSFKDVESGARHLMSSGVAQSLEIAIGNPETTVSATNAMQSTRKMADKTLRGLQLNSGRGATAIWDTVYDSKTSSFQPVYNEENARAGFRDSVFEQALNSKSTIERGVAEDRANGPSDFAQDKARVLNTALDFLERTRDHDAAITADLRGSAYRDAYATGDFSKLGASVIDVQALEDEPQQTIERKLPETDAQGEALAPQETEKEVTTNE